MKHSRVYNTRRHKKETLPNYAYGYVYSEKQNKYILPDSVSATHQAIYQDAIVGDGTVNSCINDLIIWENEIANPKLLNNALIEKAFTNYTLLNGTNINYGYGFFLSGGGATERLTYHTGGWHGYHTLLLNIIDQKKQIIILSNNEYAHFSRMADDIAEILLK
jgi:CubicO group peptidase (beta-lactamase class C family)